MSEAAPEDDVPELDTLVEEGDAGVNDNGTEEWYDVGTTEEGFRNG